MGRHPVTALISLALIASFVFASTGTASAATTSTPLNQLYLTAYGEALGRHVFEQADGTSYVSTGDIDAEWLRDASATARPYVEIAGKDASIARTLRGVIARQAKYVLIDAYANAFSANYRVVERKFELDSLLYPIWLASAYWHQTGDRSIWTGEESLSLDRTLSVIRDEQHHAQRSKYRHPQLAYYGRGSAVSYTGMIWTAFRPSDDPVRYHYNIPVNMFAVVVLRELAGVERDVYHNARQAENAAGLADEIQRAIERYGLTTLDGFGRIYAYEVDGRGHHNLMDDANVPSLLSIPYLGYLPVSDPTYQNTRRFVLSDRNPYFFAGKYAQGIGSPHTPHGYIWPLALVMQALTSVDPAEIQRIQEFIVASDIGDHRLHESFDGDRPEAFTRADFAWPNALYAELVAALLREQKRDAS